MKSILNKIFLFGLAVCTFASCNEKEYLTEEPYSIYSKSNALVSESDYQSMVNHLYYMMKITQLTIASQDGSMPLRSCNDYGFMSDVSFVNGVAVPTKYNDTKNYLTAANTKLSKTFYAYWDVICNANVVINNIDKAGFSQTKKDILKAEALFCRSWCYLQQAHIYGGMPILEEEVIAPRRDYVRATREETYQFALTGFTEAANILPDVENADDGQANKQICQHFMCEANICLKNYSEAIKWADAVINHPGCSLMTERFGNLKDKPGDVYWDLFRLGNYNYHSGNHEALFVYQIDYGNPASIYANKGSRDTNAREYNCMYFNMSVVLEAGKPAISPFTSYPVVGLFGRACGYNHPTDHFFYDIWEGMDGDIRNSEYNIIRDVRCNNKKYPETYGKWFVADGILDKAIANGYEIKSKYWWPFISKVANTVYDWPEKEIAEPFVPDEFYYAAANTDNTGGRSRDDSQKDSYMARLADTYLLRAEAHVLNNQPDKAAEDINVLRDRAHAPRVNKTVDIDYVLDERMRELYTEEFRTVTLMRMGKYVERTKKYNEVTIGLDDYNNLFPIPLSVIENNVYAKFEQNPGY